MKKLALELFFNISPNKEKLHFSPKKVVIKFFVGGNEMKNYQVTVEFCMMWNYAPKAASLAEELFTHFRSEISEMKLVPSSGGAFEVTVNGNKLYSKLDTGIFPKSEEIINKMQS